MAAASVSPAEIGQHPGFTGQSVGPPAVGPGGTHAFVGQPAGFGVFFYGVSGALCRPVQCVIVCVRCQSPTSAHEGSPRRIDREIATWWYLKTSTWTWSAAKCWPW